MGKGSAGPPEPIPAGAPRLCSRFPRWGKSVNRPANPASAYVEEPGDVGGIVVSLADCFKLQQQGMFRRQRLAQGIAEIKQLPADDFQRRLHHLDVQLLAAELLPFLQQCCFLHQGVQLQVSLFRLQLATPTAQVFGNLLDLCRQGSPTFLPGIAGPNPGWQREFGVARDGRQTGLGYCRGSGLRERSDRGLLVVIELAG